MACAVAKSAKAAATPGCPTSHAATARAVKMTVCTQHGFSCRRRMLTALSRYPELGK